MRLLYRIFGWPHELLHVLALWLIGRRAVSVTQTHVDIPDDLSTRQYVFVAGLPALVFWGVALIAMQSFFSAQTVAQTILWLLITAIFGLQAFGTLGDVHLIIMRLSENRSPDDFE